MDAGLRGSVVLITGASGGIGQATARAFAAEGAQLILHYHRNRPAAEALCAELGPTTLALGADLRDERQTDRLFTAALRRRPRIDVLVANAGSWIAQPAPLHAMPLAQWRSTLESNLNSTFLTCRAFLRHLARTPRESAAIVLVGSTAGLFGEEGHADYAAAKAGVLLGLTRTLKNEIVRLAPRGRVNCVCPGWTLTPLTHAALADAGLVARVTSTMALRKLACPEDVAAAVVFLASPRLAGHVSGAILPVAGGMEGRLLHALPPAADVIAAPDGSGPTTP